MARINTVNVSLDVKPAELFSDERVFRLPREVRFSYMALQGYASQLNATTASEYTGGEFSRRQSLCRVRDLLESDLDEMLLAGLVSEVDGDRWRVEFTSTQPTAEKLQAAADANAARAEGRRVAALEKRQDQQEKQATTDHKRERNRERQRRHRDRVNSETTTTLTSSGYCPTCETTTVHEGRAGVVRCTRCCRESLGQKEFDNEHVPF